MQEEAVDAQINKNFIEQWLKRLRSIVSPRPQCFWLFLARINELALLCASRYVDCCEFAAADEFLVEPRRVLLTIERGRALVSVDTGGRTGQGGKYVPDEKKAGPLLPYLYDLLKGSAYMTEEYLLSVSLRTQKIKQVADMLTSLGMGKTEDISGRLSDMDVDQRRHFRSSLCLFERKTFNEIGRALHLFMHHGSADNKYVSKYLRG